MSRDDNLQTQQKAGELINSGDHDEAVATLFAEDAVDHDPAPGQPAGREGFRQFFSTLFEAFADIELAPEVLVADDDHVAMAYTLKGTHRGDFHGVAATGRTIEVRGLQIGRFVDGRIVERWGATDELTIVQQLGGSVS